MALVIKCEPADVDTMRSINVKVTTCRWLVILLPLAFVAAFVALNLLWKSVSPNTDDLKLKEV